jgi:hypothetical protein
MRATVTQLQDAAAELGRERVLNDPEDDQILIAAAELVGDDQTDLTEISNYDRRKICTAFDKAWTAARETDEQKERRLLQEASEICLGRLGDPNDHTDRARVEVSWQDGRDEEHCGHFIVFVRVPPYPEGMSEAEHEDWDRENHPASLAETRVGEELDRRMMENDWIGHSIDDVRSDN